MLKENFFSKRPPIFYRKKVALVKLAEIDSLGDAQKFP